MEGEFEAGGQQAGKTGGRDTKDGGTGRATLGDEYSAQHRGSGILYIIGAREIPHRTGVGIVSSTTYCLRHVTARPSSWFVLLDVFSRYSLGWEVQLQVLPVRMHFA